MKSTGGAFRTVTTTAPLAPGTNTIRLTANTATGPAIDALSLA